MTCKECFNYNLCQETRLLVPKENCENRCAFFKDKFLIVELPCEVGDTVYIVEYLKINEDKVTEFQMYDDIIYVAFKKRYDYSDTSEFGKTVFLTKEEAEEAVKQNDLPNK